LKEFSKICEIDVLTEKTAYIYEFETFRLDPERKCLWHADTLVSLTPKAFETLLVLVRNSGEVVGKRELLDEVWSA
jgi:DNA-binding winged helix-turn-helix (wHTH) protein